MKTKLIISAALISLSMLAFAGDESSELSSNDRLTGDFYGLVVNANANVILSQGEKTSVRVEGEGRLVNQVSTEVNNGALVISGMNSRPVDIYITVGDINLIEVNGAGKVYANGPINSDILLLKINGNGSIRADVRALTVGMIVKGNGKIIASGSSGDSFIRVYGNGKVFASNLDSFSRTEETVALTDSRQGRRMKLKLHE
jgi:hypothetical protein